MKWKGNEAILKGGPLDLKLRCSRLLKNEEGEVRRVGGGVVEYIQVTTDQIMYEGG